VTGNADPLANPGRLGNVTDNVFVWPEGGVGDFKVYFKLD